MTGMKLMTSARRSQPRIPVQLDPASPVLEARSVTVTYDHKTVLKNVSASVKVGNVLAIVGPNGAGKSTLLGVLSGDITPDSGTLTIDGAPFEHWSSNELAMRRGVLLQQVDVSFPFTVTQIVRMGRAPWAATSAEDWDEIVIAQAMEATETAVFANRTFSSLSGGERSRSAQARVLAQEPMVLLLDEPTAALDIRHQELTLALARQRAARGDAVAIVMHDLSLAAAYADEVLVLANGETKGFGAPAEVFTAQLLSSVYDHPIEVIPHPHTGEILVVPLRCAQSPNTAEQLLAGS